MKQVLNTYVHMANRLIVSHLLLHIWTYISYQCISCKSILMHMIGNKLIGVWNKIIKIMGSIDQFQFHDLISEHVFVNSKYIYVIKNNAQLT